MSSSNNCIYNIEDTLKERKLKYTNVDIKMTIVC